MTKPTLAPARKTEPIRLRRSKQDLEVFSDLTELGKRSAKDTVHVPKYMYKD